MSTPMTNPEWLKLAARRSGQHASMLGYVFEQYLLLEHKTREQLAEELGCSLEVLDWVSLCRRPEQAQFEAQLDMIAERFGVKAHLLANVILQVEVAGDLVSSRDAGELVGEDPMLLAARDHTKDEEPE